MLESHLPWLALVWSALFGSPALDPESARATTEGTRAEIARLQGHRVEILAADAVASQPLRYVIHDIAGQGPPWIGVVRARDGALHLETSAGESLRLLGPLARPRIAGPGYKIWVVGERQADGASLVARRIGVLAPPASLPPR